MLGPVHPRRPTARAGAGSLCSFLAGDADHFWMALASWLSVSCSACAALFR